VFCLIKQGLGLRVTEKNVKNIIIRGGQKLASKRVERQVFQKKTPYFYDFIEFGLG